MLGDLIGDAHIRLGVLIVDGQVFALHNAGLGQAHQEALPAVVQRAMLGELGDADGILLGFGGGGQREAHQEYQGSHDTDQFFHGGILLAALGQ